MCTELFINIFLFFQMKIFFLSFEEMRMRYERREPRAEDLAKIDELKTVVDSQEKDICQLTEQLRDLQLQMQSYQQQQQNSNQSSGGGGGNKRSRGKNNNNNKTNRNNANNNQQQQQVKQQQSNAVNQEDESEQQQQQQQQQRVPQNKQQRMRPPPLIKTVIYEEENENELYEQQIREERERAAAELNDDNFTVELVPESPDFNSDKRILEEISEALIVHEHEILNQPVIPSPTPDHKNQEIAIEVISTIEPSNIQIIPNNENSLDLELD